MFSIQNVVLIATCISLLSSCQFQDENADNNVPTYTFEENDYQFLLDDYNQTGKELTFSNQNNEVFSFTFDAFVQEIKTHQSQGGLGPPTFPTIFSYYEIREFYYRFNQLDTSINKLKIRFIKFEGILGGSIELPLWNVGITPSFDSGAIDFNGATFQMSVNNENYNDVIKIESGDNTVMYTIEEFNRNVHIIYYDLKKGFIGFDDLEGGHWRLN